MESAESFAVKYGLEHYLDKPDELNGMILKLMALQESLQTEQSKKMKVAAKFISTKRISQGKFIAACRGDDTYRYAVETALRAATDVVAVFQRGRFIRMLKSMGLPDDKITEFSNTVVIDDDTHCIDADQS
jgi:hypothetical protein